MLNKIILISLFATVIGFANPVLAKSKSASRSFIKSTSWPAALVFTNKEMTRLDIVDRSYSNKMDMMKGSVPEKNRFIPWIKLINSKIAARD